MASWEVKYILPHYGTKYFYHEVEAKDQVEAAKVFMNIVPQCKIIGSPKRV